MATYKYDKTTGELTRIAGGTLYADAPVGGIMPFGGTVIPAGWLACSGQAISRTDYADLFAVIGTYYGSGDGSTTFNVPDLREATPKGTGLSGKSSNHYSTGGITLGQFVEDRVQAHTHSNRTGSTIAGSEAWTMFATSQVTSAVEQTNDGLVGRFGNTTEVKAVGVNFIIKAKPVGLPADFADAVEEAIDTSNLAKVSPYSFNHSSNVGAFNRKWLVSGSSIVWTATHTGRLTIRCLKHGDGYSLYLTNQDSVMLDSYDNFLGDDTHALTSGTISITLQGWVKKGDVIELSTNLPASTDWADKYFVQTALLVYNDNYD